MNTSDRTPAAALSPALLAAVAALASVASWCTSVRATSDSYDRPSLTDIYAALGAALASPHAANLAALADALDAWRELARGRVRAAGIAARDGAAGLYDYDPEDRAGDAAVEAYLLSHAPDPSPAAEHDGAEVPDAPAGPTCEACGEQPPADGAAGLCFACGWDELAAPRPAPVEALDDHCDPWVPVRAAA